ncbi:MAG: TIGR02646 family protein [Betaproteobacteria bacterium]|nr:TIGR02646 family protein [Betaproteobacteria bacterium]
MVELQHRLIPTPALTNFVSINQNIAVSDFDSPTFGSIKSVVKADLNQDQDGLCAYCECQLAANAGQLDHIKPKAGKHAYPQLCFEYSNLAHSCINSRTCGQKKKGGLLPIEPGIGCNAKWLLSTNGTIEPVLGLTRRQKHDANQTRDMLGLNNDSNLVDERKRWLGNALAILQSNPPASSSFLQQAPYRHILATVL